MDRRKLQLQIRSLDPWFCPVSIDGIKITPGIGSGWSAVKLTNRIVYRSKLLVDEVAKRYNFSGKRILDLACNCAYWSARYAERGANYILGVEGRKKVLEQAKLYWKHNKFLKSGNYEFLLGNVTGNRIWDEIKNRNKFDVCLCAGILYHIPNYRKLLARISGVVNDLIIIDTRVGDSYERLIKEPGDLCFNAIKQTQNKTVPNLGKMLQYLSKLSLKSELLSIKDPIPAGLTGEDDYTKKRRVTILAWKG